MDVDLLNLEKFSTGKVAENTPFGFSMSMISSFKMIQK